MVNSLERCIKSLKSRYIFCQIPYLIFKENSKQNIVENSQVLKSICILKDLTKYIIAVVLNFFGTRDRFHGRQFFHEPSRGMVSR